MAKYTAHHRIKHDGKAYHSGDTLELTEQQAAQMPHAVTLQPQEPSEKTKNSKNGKKSQGED